MFYKNVVWSCLAHVSCVVMYRCHFEHTLHALGLVLVALQVTAVHMETRLCSTHVRFGLSSVHTLHALCMYRLHVCIRCVCADTFWARYTCHLVLSGTRCMRLSCTAYDFVHTLHALCHVQVARAALHV